MIIGFVVVFPIIIFSIMFLMSEKIKTSILVTIPSIIMTFISILILKIDNNLISWHPEIIKTIASFELNFFNILMGLMIILISVFINISLKREKTKKIRAFTITIFVIGSIIQVILTKMFFCYQ